MISIQYSDASATQGAMIDSKLGLMSVTTCMLPLGYPVSSHWVSHSNLPQV